jgi:hypothetical protein
MARAIDIPATPHGFAVDPNLNRLHGVITTINQPYVCSAIGRYKLITIIS